jgi:hypothetical protein
VATERPDPPAAYGGRSARFNETTGVYGYMSQSGPLGGNHHPDRCVCQGNPHPVRETAMGLRRGVVGPNGDTTPHKHYPEPPYGCARCSCSAYAPHDEATKNALRRQAREVIEANCAA